MKPPAATPPWQGEDLPKARVEKASRRPCAPSASAAVEPLRELDGSATDAEPFGGWETAFVATAALLGEPVEAIAAALGPAAARTKSLLAAFESPLREVRARALARGLAGAIVALESLRLR